ncbi:MAG: hypothetical protein OEZ68_01950 [Gammaproteobacteria bacterium]|nr:hypothetical protein [Gammaproteobacteria bacterium]MDH5799544.1 hypothetical protein [Gammaproteobacteria bacterium]
MTPLTEMIITTGQADRILSACQIARLLGGGDARRYGQVNRALKAGELLRARRGLYVLNPVFRKTPIHPFTLAQQIEPGSYVSAESALSFHGWIPEAVNTVLSMTPRGKSVNYENDRLGRFEFRRMTVNGGYFLQAVMRHELQQQVALIAEPLRALLDLVYLCKFEWQGLDFLYQGLRVDEQKLQLVNELDITCLLDVYKGKRELAFIQGLKRELAL